MSAFGGGLIQRADSEAMTTPAKKVQAAGAAYRQSRERETYINLKQFHNLTGSRTKLSRSAVLKAPLAHLNIQSMTKCEKIAALMRMTVDRGCTPAEAETARRLAAKLLAERAPTGTIARSFDPPVTMDLHRSREPRTTRGRR
jgi:hypothetical protein